MTTEQQAAFDRLHKPEPVRDSAAGICNEPKRYPSDVQDEPFVIEPYMLSDELTECDLSQDDKDFYNDCI